MVARPTAHRFRLFERSLRGYLAQTHANRELIVVMSHLSRRERRAAVQHVQRLGRSDIRLRYVAGNPSLGRLRNISIDMATGGLCCQWDDDDIYHPCRLEIQLREMRRARRKAVFLQTLLQFFEKDARALRSGLELQLAPVQLPSGDRDCRSRTRSSAIQSGAQTRKRGEDVVFMVRHRERHGHVLLRPTPISMSTCTTDTNTWDDRPSSRASQGADSLPCRHASDPRRSRA